MPSQGAASTFPRDRVTIVGVLNLTPDSFSDGGRLLERGHAPRVPAALAAARALLEQGAHILDVGGESTRPGAEEISVDEECDRTLPVIAALAEAFDAPISIDTRKPLVARAALEAGASIVNDVSGLQYDPALAQLAAERGATLILGHTRGNPQQMQRRADYDDVLLEVVTELEAAVEVATAAGVAREQLVADPGIGFAKRAPESIELLAHCGWLRDRLALPLLVGPSRKSFLGHITGDPVEAREAATIAACAVAVFAGADALRVHDAAGARRAAAVGAALRAARRKELT